MILIKLIQYFTNRFIRNIYWLYNLNRIKGINTTNIKFPIIIEGKGKVFVGKNTKFAKRLTLKTAKNCTLKIGDRNSLDSNVYIVIANNSSLETSANVTIGKQSRLHINNNWTIGKNVVIATYCSIFSREYGHWGKLSIGEGTHIGDNTIIDVTDNITIGNEVALGPNCVIYSHDHDYTDKKEAAWKGKLIKKPVIIKDAAWIGSGVTILPGVTIGEHCVIAAGAVITKNTEANSVYGGVPAKQIKRI